MKVISNLLMVLHISLAGSLFAGTEGKASLSGKVTDKKDGHPLINAQIYFPDLRIGASSKADGSYSITELPPTKLLVRVSLVGYASITRTIDLTTTTQEDFAMEVAVTEVSEVVVTGTSKATELKRDPVPTVLLDHR